MILRLIGSTLAAVGVYALAILLPAGTLRWPRAWALLGVVLLATVATLVRLARGHADILRERMKPPVQEGQPLADKVLVLLMIGSYFGQIAFASLDVFRFHLLGVPGPRVAWLGLALFLAGWWLMARALEENAFAAPVVRHLAERHQVVVESGPYAVVRHPMYAAALPLMAGLPLWLGSWAATVAAIVPFTFLALRIPVEERLLARDLAGYEAYRRRVRYRVLPGVW